MLKLSIISEKWASTVLRGIFASLIKKAKNPFKGGLTSSQKPLFWIILSLSFSTLSTFAQDSTVLQAIENGYTLLNKGDKEGAISSFDNAIQKDPENVNALLGRAMVFASQERHSKAFIAYDAVVKRTPENAFAWNGRGLAAFNLEDFDQALFSFERSTLDNPVNGFFYESMAWALMCRGDFNRAAESAKQATLMYSRIGKTTIYPIFIAYFSYAENGDINNAQRTLSYAARNKPRKGWPAPIVDYLTGLIDREDLISYVSNTAEETEAHTYIGLNLRSQQQFDDASKHLSWVSRNGDTRVFEYTLARAINLQNRMAMMEP